MTRCPCCCHQPCLCRHWAPVGGALHGLYPVTRLGQPFLSPCSLSALWSDLWAQHPLQASGDHGVVTDTQAVCVPQRQGVFTLLWQLRGVKVDQGGQEKFH